MIVKNQHSTFYSLNVILRAQDPNKSRPRDGSGDISLRGANCAGFSFLKCNISTSYFYHAALRQEIEYDEIVSSIPSADGFSPPMAGFFYPSSSPYQARRYFESGAIRRDVRGKQTKFTERIDAGFLKWLARLVRYKNARRSMTRSVGAIFFMQYTEYAARLSRNHALKFPFGSMRCAQMFDSPGKTMRDGFYLHFLNRN